MGITLYLARHGQPEGGAILRGRREDGLSGLGVLQAYRLGRRLPALTVAGPALDVAYTSPLRRARQTADIALLGTGMQAVRHAGLMEVDWGDLTGVSVAEAERRKDPTIAAWRRGEDFAPPGGEPREQLESRVLCALSDIVASKPSTALLVTHGGPIQVILAALMGDDYPGRPEWAVPEGSLTAVETTRAGAQLLFLGDTSHLAGLA
jgi:probable phosphoglycerate mutase